MNTLFCLISVPFLKSVPFFVQIYLYRLVALNLTKMKFLSLFFTFYLYITAKLASFQQEMVIKPAKELLIAFIATAFKQDEDTFGGNIR